MVKITPEEARAYTDRWTAVEALQLEELRRTPMETKLLEPAALIKGLLDAHPDADLDIVRQWVREFATAMTMPDLFEGFERIVASKR